MGDMRGMKTSGSVVARAETIALRRLRQEDGCEFETNLRYMVNARPAWAMEWDLVSNKQVEDKFGRSLNWFCRKCRGGNSHGNEKRKISSWG